MGARGWGKAGLAPIVIVAGLLLSVCKVNHVEAAEDEAQPSATNITGGWLMRQFGKMGCVWMVSMHDLQ